MASFDDLYRMQQGQNNPLINLQQMQARMPNWLTAPTPQSGNLGAARLFTEQMNRIGNVQRQDIGIDQNQQRLDIERQRAKDVADIQMQTFQAELAQKQKKSATDQTLADIYADPNLTPEEKIRQVTAAMPREAANLQMKSAFAQPKPSGAESVYNWLYPEGKGPERGAWYEKGFKPSGPQINIGGALGPPPQIAGMIRKQDPNTGEFSYQNVEGAPEKTVSTEQRKAEAFAEEQTDNIGFLMENLFDGDRLNRGAALEMRKSGTALNKAFRNYLQNGGFIKSGAVSSEKEINEMADQMEPSMWQILMGSSEDIKRQLTKPAKFARTKAHGESKREVKTLPSGRKYWVEP
jgi:hypothetical protein